MDVQMPKMDGYTATRRIRAGDLVALAEGEDGTALPAELPTNGAPPTEAELMVKGKAREYLVSVPIIAMTASAISGDREKSKDAGMDDYLAKPVRGQVLEKMLLKWCSRNARAREEQQAREAKAEEHENATETETVTEATYAKGG